MSPPGTYERAVAVTNKQGMNPGNRDLALRTNKIAIAHQAALHLAAILMWAGLRRLPTVLAGVRPDIVHQHE